MARRPMRERTTYLPWERRDGWVRRLGLGRARPFLTTLAIVGTILWIASRDRQRTGVRVTRAALLSVKKGVDAYRSDHDGRCPRDLQELGAGHYLVELPEDAWGHPFRYSCPSRHEGEVYDVSSDGPDGEPGGLDRIE